MTVKLRPPEPGPYFVRPALVKKLTTLVETPGRVWISSPGGAGKTALVRNLLTTDPRPLLWYQVDADDHDPANLFFYLAQAASELDVETNRIPLLTPEYLPNLEYFSRTFCRALFASIKQAFVLVFDDLQEGPGESLFGPFLSAATSELPQGSSIIMLSREEPFPLFARDRLNGQLAHLCWDDLRLSAEETRFFIAWSHEESHPPQSDQHAYDLTQGWLAGLLLYLQNAENLDRPHEFSLDQSDLLFDYFAGEIFARLPVESRDLLRLCSLMPTIDITMARELTGQSNTGEMLRELVRKNYFIYRISSKPEVYRFHPLFRQFLLTNAAASLEHRRLSAIREAAARLLVKEGQFESAAELMIEASAWPQLIELISSQAENLLSQGRFQTLLQWLDALPAKLRDKNPRLVYWHGNCLMTTNPTIALVELSQAFDLFDREGDTAGSMLSWSMVVNAIVIVWENLDELDRWIEHFDRLRERHSEYPSPAIESLMVQGICKSLVWRNPSRADLPYWADRLHQLVTTSSDVDFRLLAGSNLVLYHIISGDIAVAQSLVEMLNSDLHSDTVSPMKKLVWLSTRAGLEWVLLDRSGCIATLEAGRTLIEESGVHVLDVRLYAQGVTLGLTTGDLPLVSRLFDEFPKNPIATSLDHAHYALLLAERSLQEGQVTKAVALAETAAKRANDGGNLVIKVMSYSVLVMALFEDGQTGQAEHYLIEGLAISKGMNLFSSNLCLLAAYFALKNGDGETASHRLREGFGMAARQGYLNFIPWRDEIMTRLCQEALAAGIEETYVKRLTSQRQLDTTQPTPNPLTPKEMETLNWVKRGKTTWEIAKIQGISERTVKFHVGNILRKLDANSRTQAVAIALEMGFLDER